MFTWKTVYMEINTKIENKINIKTHFKSPQNVIEMQHKIILTQLYLVFQD